MTDTDTETATTTPDNAEPVEQTPQTPQVVVGVRFHEAARLHHYSAPAGALFVGDYVVVETARGEELARVVATPDPPDPAEQPRPAPASIPRGVHPILRQATREDRDQAAAGRERAAQMVEQLRRIALRDQLDLYPVAVQLNLNGDEGTGYFQASDHVDFRAAVEEIEAEHGVALHMQQAGPRERAMLVDGYDICGLRLCCASWMTNFPKVGIRSAKTQGLSLNPDSISGVCGRLLCCLTFEHDVYREMRGTLPKLGKRVSTPAGMGKVIKQNILQQYVTIALDDHPERVDVPVAEIGLAVRTEDAPNQALAAAEQREQPREREPREREPRERAPRERERTPRKRAPREQASEQAQREREPGEREPREQAPRAAERDSAPRPRRQRRNQPRTQQAPREQREPGDRPRTESPPREQRDRPHAEPPREAAAPPPPKTTPEQEPPTRRRRRRRTVNQDSPPRPTVQPSPRTTDTPPPRRRKRRPRQTNPDPTD